MHSSEMWKLPLSSLLFYLGCTCIFYDGLQVVAVKANNKAFSKIIQSSQDAQNNKPKPADLATTKEAPIPDLNFDPPPEEEQTASPTYRKGAFLKKDKDGVMKTRFAIYTASRKKKGTLNEFRTKEQKRHKTYREALPDDERIARSKKYQKNMSERLEQVNI